MTTVYELPTITTPANSDVLVLQPVSLGVPGITGKITVEQLVSFIPAASVNTSAVAAAGALMTSYVSGAAGYVKKINSSTYSANPTIAVTEISGLVLNAITNVSVPSPTNQQFLQYNTSKGQWIPASVAAGGTVNLSDVSGFGATGLAVASAGTPTSVRTILGLGTLALQDASNVSATALNANTITVSTINGITITNTTNAFLSISSGVSVGFNGDISFNNTNATNINFGGGGTLIFQGPETYVGRNTTDTLANKTLTNPIVNTGTFNTPTVSAPVINAGITGVITVEAASSIYGYQGKFNSIAGSSYTLVSSDTGKVLSTTAAVTVSITLPNSMQPGFNVTFLQKGSGVIQFTAGTSTVLEQRQSYTKSAGLYAAVGLIVSENSNGTAAHYLLSGDMA